VTLNIKVEILKVISLELNFDSGKKLEDKEQTGEENSNADTAPADKQ
jgi:hypothetical protein